MELKRFYKHKNWYRKTRSTLINRFGKDYKLFAGLLASTSPRFQVKRNFNTSLKLYRDYLKGKEVFLAYAVENKKTFIKKYKLLPAHYNNIIRTLSHNYAGGKLELGGMKVNAFYQNITGNYNAVTLDVWMIKYFKLNKGWLNIGEYRLYSRVIRKLAQRLGLLPAELQAVIWERQRAKEGRKPSNFFQYLINA